MMGVLLPAVRRRFIFDPSACAQRVPMGRLHWRSSAHHRPGRVTARSL